MATWRTGSAGEDTSLYRGWLVGHFIDTDDLRYSRNVEVKMGGPRSGRRTDRMVARGTRADDPDPGHRAMAP